MLPGLQQQEQSREGHFFITLACKHNVLLYMTLARHISARVPAAHSSKLKELIELVVAPLASLNR